ncbi:MAG: hypothetical protein WDN04_23695 [Rhodospirillales bacterium]
MLRAQSRRREQRGHVGVGKTQRAVRQAVAQIGAVVGREIDDDEAAAGASTRLASAITCAGSSA